MDWKRVASTEHQKVVMMVEMMVAQLAVLMVSWMGTMWVVLMVYDLAKM